MAEREFGLRYIDRDSLMHRVYPLTKAAWVLVVAIGLFVYQQPRSGAIMFIVATFMALVVSRVPLRSYVSSSRFIFGIGVLVMIFHFFADPGEPVFKVGPLDVTDGGLITGPVFFFRLSVIVLVSFIFIWTTDLRDLMVTLADAGMPYRYAYAVFLSMRFLPLVQREVDAVQAAHLIRGRASRSGLLHRFRLWQRYMFTVLINGLRKAEATATAIECRGFGAYPDRTYVKQVPFEPFGLILPIVFAALTAALIYVERVT